MSMTRDQLVRYLDDSSSLNERTLGELKEILEEYPYFQTAHLLYIKNLQVENNFRFSGQLRTCATYATDRTILYQLLNSPAGKRELISDNALEINSSSRKGSPMLELTDDPTLPKEEVSETLRHAISHGDIQNFDLLNFELPDRVYSLENIEDEKTAAQAESVEEVIQSVPKRGKGRISEQKDELIDRFIKGNPAFTVKQVENPERGRQNDPQIDSGGDKDEFITETLARIYMNQGLYQKAINAFEKLSLKYPEKSAYFARQIEEVTNLLNK